MRKRGHIIEKRRAHSLVETGYISEESDSALDLRKRGYFEGNDSSVERSEIELLYCVTSSSTQASRSMHEEGECLHENSGAFLRREGTIFYRVRVHI